MNDRTREDDLALIERGERLGNGRGLVLIDGTDLRHLCALARRGLDAESMTLAGDAVNAFRMMISGLYTEHHLISHDATEKLSLALQTAYGSAVNQERIAIQRAVREHGAAPINEGRAADAAVGRATGTIANAAPATQSAPSPSPAPTDDLVARAVDLFLAWPLPKDFAPDCGISFDGRGKDARGYDKGWPIGTNLFMAEQARAMFAHCLSDAAAALEAKDREIERLHERLEDSFVIDMDGNRKPVAPGSIPDGIACRDETIRQLEADLAAARLECDSYRTSQIVQDAMRYRWLREEREGVEVSFIEETYDGQFDPNQPWYEKYSAELDAAIDAAIAGSGKEA